MRYDDGGVKPLQLLRVSAARVGVLPAWTTGHAGRARPTLVGVSMTPAIGEDREGAGSGVQCAADTAWLLVPAGSAAPANAPSQSDSLGGPAIAEERVSSPWEPP